MKLPTGWSWEALNATYIRESGMESKPYLSKEFAWANWSRCGFTEEELVQTLRYLCAEVRAGRRQAACKSFRTLIEQTSNFEHELSLCKEAALRHKPALTPRQRVLAQSGRPEQPPEQCKTVKTVLEGQALKDFMAKCRADAGI